MCVLSGRIVIGRAIPLVSGLHRVQHSKQSVQLARGLDDAFALRCVREAEREESL